MRYNVHVGGITTAIIIIIKIIFTQFVFIGRKFHYDVFAGKSFTLILLSSSFTSVSRVHHWYSLLLLFETLCHCFSRSTLVEAIGWNTFFLIVIKCLILICVTSLPVDGESHNFSVLWTYCNQKQSAFAFQSRYDETLRNGGWKKIIVAWYQFSE